MRVWDATGRLTKKHDYKKETRNYFTTFYNAKGQKTAQGESVMLKKKGKNVGFKKKGYWTYWKNGKKRYAAHQNGKRFVSVIDWWEDDGIHCQFRHARPGKSERVTCKYPSGAKESEGAYDHDFNRTGEWRFYKKNGTMMAKGSFVKSLQHGLWTEYHKDGYLTTKMKHGNQIGKSVWHQKDGAKATYTAKKSKRPSPPSEFGKNGAVNEWYPNGNLRLIANYRAGVKDGAFSKYYENGQQSQRGTFQRGKRVGLWVLWNQDGTKDREIFFRSDEVMVATRFVWYDHGQLHYMKKKVSADFSETKQFETETIFWFANGAKDIHLLRKNGALEGVQKSYYTSGKLRKKETYKKGISQEQYVLFYADGSKALEKSNPRKRGADAEAIYWNEQGDKVAERYRDAKDAVQYKYYADPDEVERVLHLVAQIENHRRRFRPKPPENAKAIFGPRRS